MRKKIVFIIFSIILIASDAFAVSLKVSVTNATKGESLSGYPFKILSVEQDKYGDLRVLKTYEFQTGPSGIFEGEVDVSPGEAVMGEVNYRGVAYHSPLIRITKGQEDYTLNFNVYEITDDARKVEITQRTMMITPHDDRTVMVYDTIIIRNNSRLTYVGKYNDKLKINQVLFIPLPAGYSLINVWGLDQRGIYTLVGGLATRNEILPGESSISLSYFVRSDTGVFDMSMHVDDNGPPLKKISLFFKNKEKWKVKSSSLLHKGKRKFEGGVYGTYHVWEASGLRDIKFKVLAPSHKGLFSLWQVSVLAAFIAAGTGLFVMKKRLYRWNLMREKKRLDGILARLRSEADKEDLKGYYMSFRKVLEDRTREIEERLGS
ncbi:MAG: hypothetical protein GXP46_03080 [Deferribacteres bacterium]|nr:hypothetical protein [Deferribacteres bacterium]